MHSCTREHIVNALNLEPDLLYVQVHSNPDGNELLFEDESGYLDKVKVDQYMQKMFES